MRIVIVTDAWAPQVNGVVTTLTNTISCLEDLGHVVEVIEPGQFIGPSLPWLHGLKLALPPYQMSKRLAGADAIHIVTEGALGFAARCYCDRKGIPYSTAFHTNYAVYLNKHFGLSENVGFALLRWFHKNSAAMMVPSPSMIEVLQREGFKNAVHWRRGVDGSIFNSKPRTSPEALLSDLGPGPYWLNVGRVSREKNLEAFLNLDLPGTKIVVGDGPDLELLKARYPAAKFMGARRGADLADFYRAANVFVFPSGFDTYGLVIAEAISCGTPVAAFPVTGPIDIIVDGCTGAMSGDLAAACLAALELAAPVQTFDWMTATKDFEAHLHPVIKAS